MPRHIPGFPASSPTASKWPGVLPSEGQSVSGDRGDQTRPDRTGNESPGISWLHFHYPAAPLEEPTKDFRNSNKALGGERGLNIPLRRRLY